MKFFASCGKGLDVVNQLTQKYADENNVQNPPLE